MAQFLFKLDGVLRHRKNIEHQRQRDVAEIQAKLVKLEVELREMDAQVQNVNNDVRDNRLTGSIDTNFLIAHRRFLAGAQRQAMAVAQKMADVQIKLDAARKLLIEAARDRKGLEKLKEKQHEAWQQAMARKDAAAMDEVGTQLSYRNLVAETGADA